MQEIRVAAVQFEARDKDKEHNLDRIEQLVSRAVEQGANLVCFHEGCIPGYSWVQPLDKQQLLAVAEPVPDGESVTRLIDIARRYDTCVMAGLFERDEHDNVFNSYVTVGSERVLQSARQVKDSCGLIARFHKLHPFVNPHLSPGAGFRVIELFGCRIGFLICYDNNLPENVRITAMLGAEIIVMPHVTGCLPSVMPGRGSVDPMLWDNRYRDPVPLRQEFQGPKGRGWLMRWLPTRAFENGVYAVFANPIGRDFDTIKPGLAMILDPFGEILAESDALEDDVVLATLTPEKLAVASGLRYRKARRPELYGPLVEPQESVTLPGWQLQHDGEKPDA